MNKIITVTSGKGGAGKSSVCAFLGQALAAAGCRTLLVELDCGLRCLDLMLSLEKTPVFDLKDLLSGRCSPDQAAVAHGVHGRLRLIPASQDHQYILPENAFAQLMRWSARHYDVVLLDAPAGLRIEAEIAARQSHTSILVTTPDLAAVRDCGRAAQLLRRQGLSSQRLIINKVPSVLSQRQGLEDLDDVIDGTGVQLLGVVPLSEEISRAGALGQTLATGGLAERIFEAIAARIQGKNAELLIS